MAIFTSPELAACEAPARGLEELEVELLELDELSVAELALVDALAFEDGSACWASETCEADETEDADEVESTVERRFSRYALSAADSLATSETISDSVDDETLESVDDEVAIDAVETLDDELDDSSAARRVVRSVSSSDSRLLALDELSVELEEVELLETPGGGPGGGPPTPPGPPVEAPLAELWLPLDESPPSCDRKASTAADRPTAVDASDEEIALLVDADVDALAVDVSEELL